MQQTLTLLAGDSKERENKGGGWKTKERGKKGGEVAPHLLTSHETDGDNLCRFFLFFFFCHQLPFAVFCLFCFTYLTVIAPRCPVILAQWALRQTKSLHVHSTRGLRLNSNLFFFFFLPFLNYLSRKTSEAKSLWNVICCKTTYTAAAF